MSKVNGVINSIAKLITWVFVVLLMLGVIGGVAYFALRSQGVTYYVEYNDEKYYANGEGGSIKLYATEENVFTVRSIIGEDVNYDVKIYANSANNFAFSFEDKQYHFVRTDDESMNDYTEVFGLNKSKNEFSFTIPKDFTVEQAVEQKYGGDIQLTDTLNSEYAYFVIEVTADKNNVDLWFSFSNFSVVLTPSAIVF